METPEWVKRAKVGDKVVALKDGEETELKRGQVYTIRGIYGDYLFHSETCPVGFYAAIYVRGVHRRFVDGEEIPLSARNFKPVSKRSTDTGMQTLKSILNGSPVTETENAH